VENIKRGDDKLVTGKTTNACKIFLPCETDSEADCVPAPDRRESKIRKYTEPMLMRFNRKKEEIDYITRFFGFG